MSNKKKYANILANECVACGSCIKACPRSAISVPCGISAKLIEIYVLDVGFVKRYVQHL